MGRRENIFIPRMDFVAEESRGFWEDFNATFIVSLFQDLRRVRVAAPEKQTSAD